jgi:hypothetical protein
LKDPHTDADGKRPDQILTCPCCRTELRALEGPAGRLYRCSEGHGYTPRGLLAEQEKLAARILRDVKATLETQLAFSAELASRAGADGQHRLLRYLDRVMDSGHQTLGFVQGSLREHDDLSE